VTRIAAVLGLLAILTTLSLPPQTALASPAQADRIDALHQRVEHLREQRSALRQRVTVIGAAWWRLDRTIFYMHDTLEMELPSEVLDAWEQSWEEAMGALPQL
jgi:hypothetical protein